MNLRGKEEREWEGEGVGEGREKPDGLVKDSLILGFYTGGLA